jgi:hypothetical protein
MFKIRGEMSYRIDIEEYEDKQNSSGFYLPPIPWKWTVYSKDKVVRFGYTHTEDAANKAANEVLSRLNK